MEEFRAAIHITSLIGLGIAASMLAPAFVNFVSGHPSWIDFAGIAVLSATVWGLIAIATIGARAGTTTRFGIILVNMLWWGIPLTSVGPLMAGPAQLSLVDAIFETVSGFTTTGSTVLTDLDELDPGTLLWRSMTQWFGGTGMLSIGLVVLPYLKIGGLQLFRLESSDRSEKALPQFAAIVKSITLIYLLLSVVCAISYVLSGMSVFDAINHAMTTLSTGGFSTHDKSMGYFPNSATLWVGSVFMLLGGLPFSLFISLVFNKWKPRFDPQIVWYLFIIAGASALIFLGRVFSSLQSLGDPAAAVFSFRNLAEDVFDVISVITTTGFAAGDYTTWGDLAVPLFFLLTFFGGCAGSTAGGLKIYRLVVLVEMVRSALREIAHPHGVFPVRYGRRRVDPAIFRSALVMSVSFAGVLAVSTLLVGAQGNDMVTALSGSLTALANVGPGLGTEIGPSGTFAGIADSSKITLAAAMIAGRLEILVVMALFLPTLWR